MIKNFFALLLAMAVLSIAQTVTDPIVESNCYKDSLKAEEYAALTQVDFDGYYKNLIQLEETQVKKDVFLIAASSAVVGIGAAWWLALNDDQANAHPRKEAKNKALKPSAKLISAGLIAAGTIGFSYNLYAYARDAGSDSKLNSYRKAYEVYKKRRLKAKVTTVAISPTVDVVNPSIGMNLLGRF